MFSLEGRSIGDAWYYEADDAIHMYFLTSVGGFIAGFAAEFIGVRITIAAGALSVTAFAIVVYLASAELRHLRGDDVTPPPAATEAAEAAPEAAAAS